MTVNDLIVASLRRIRVISGADPPSGDDLQDALLRLQDWLDDLRGQELLNLWEQSVAFPLVPGKLFYECPGDPGLVGVPAFASPNDIHNVGYRDAAGNDIPLGPPLTDDAYARLPNKSLTGRVPTYFYMSGGPSALTPGGGYRAYLRFWPVPTATGLFGVLSYNQPVGAMTLTTVLDGNANLPTGWRRFLRDGLALELAPEFHVSDPGVLGPLQKSVDDSKANIKRKARRLRDLAVPEWFAMTGGGNIYTG